MRAEGTNGKATTTFRRDPRTRIKCPRMTDDEVTDLYERMYVQKMMKLKSKTKESTIRSRSNQNPRGGNLEVAFRVSCEQTPPKSNSYPHHARSRRDVLGQGIGGTKESGEILLLLLILQRL